MAALDAKRWEDVERELAGLEGAAGYEPQQHFLRGALLLHGARLYPALEEFGHSVNDPVLRVRTLVLSGEALCRAGDLGNGVRLLVQAVEADSEAIDAHRLLASAFDALGLTDAAEAHLLRVAELDPADPQPLRVLGQIHKDFEDYAGAVESYRESLRREANQPDRQEVFLELAECELKLRQYDAAMATLAQASPCADRWTLEAECLYGSGRPDEAKRLLALVLRESPANLRGLMLTGTILLEEQKAAGAAEVLSRAVVAYPRDYTARFKLAQAYQRVGDARRAEEHMKVAEQIKQVREEFSRLHQKANGEPDNADVRCRLGQLARQLDRPDLARVWFRAALTINPRHEEARRGLAGGPPGKSAP
jgi:tetratricopeptide (TPR) repeat protein